MNQTAPRVSIVLPIYNGAKYMRQSIDSCLNQTYKDLELIIVDDSSTDETPEIIKTYQDKRMKYLRHERNRGLPHALNTGFAKAAGDYLTWTSDDNYYAEEAIERMLSFLKSNNCSFVYCDHYSFHNENPSNVGLMELPAVLDLGKQNDGRACFLYSRQVKEAVGDYDPDTQLAEDYDYWIRVSKKFSMCHLNEPLYFYRVHDESLYVSRYYEVKVVDFLVRLKNSISDVDQVGSLFVDLITKKRTERSKLIGRIGILNRVLLGLNEVLAKILFSGEIDRILQDFKMGGIDFVQAKSQLQALLRH